MSAPALLERNVLLFVPGHRVAGNDVSESHSPGDDTGGGCVVAHSAVTRHPDRMLRPAAVASLASTWRLETDIRGLVTHASPRAAGLFHTTAAGLDSRDLLQFFAPDLQPLVDGLTAVLATGRILQVPALLHPMKAMPRFVLVTLTRVREQTVGWRIEWRRALRADETGPDVRHGTHEHAAGARDGSAATPDPR